MLHPFCEIANFINWPHISAQLMKWAIPEMRCNKYLVFRPPWRTIASHNTAHLYKKV